MSLAGRARHTSARLLTALIVALVAYIFVQSAASLLEHDLLCHLKSRTHCTVCAMGVSAPGLTESTEPPVRDLPRAGEVEPRCEDVIAAGSVCATQNRAPPA